MRFTVTKELNDNYTKLILNGALDSETSILLHEEIKKIIKENPKDLVLDLEHLKFMASAGLRIIIFAKQKLGTTTNLVLLKPQEQTIDTLRMTGLTHSVIITDNYPM